LQISVAVIAIVLITATGTVIYTGKGVFLNFDIS
jgi:hypothetical protein